MQVNSQVSKKQVCESDIDALEESHSKAQGEEAETTNNAMQLQVSPIGVFSTSLTPEDNQTKDEFEVKQIQREHVPFHRTCCVPTGNLEATKEKNEPSELQWANQITAQRNIMETMQVDINTDDNIEEPKDQVVQTIRSKSIEVQVNLNNIENLKSAELHSKKIENLNENQQYTNNAKNIVSLDIKPHVSSDMDTPQVEEPHTKKMASSFEDLSTTQSVDSYYSETTTKDQKPKSMGFEDKTTKLPTKKNIVHEYRHERRSSSPTPTSFFDFLNSNMEDQADSDSAIYHKIKATSATFHASRPSALAPRRKLVHKTTKLSSTNQQKTTRKLPSHELYAALHEHQTRRDVATKALNASENQIRNKHMIFSFNHECESLSSSESSEDDRHCKNYHGYKRETKAGTHGYHFAPKMCVHIKKRQTTSTTYLYKKPIYIIISKLA